MHTQRVIFENHICAFGEGCPCSGHMYGNMYRDPEMGIHREAFFRTTYVRLEGVSFAVGICMEACRDPEMGIHMGIFENHIFAFGEGCPCNGHMYGSVCRGPDVGIHRGAFLEQRMCVWSGCPCSGHIACIQTQTWAYTAGIFENHVCAFGEGCPCNGHIYGNMYRGPDMGIHRGHF